MSLNISHNKTALSFKNFSFIYGIDNTKTPAVSNINFNLKERDVLILAGASGSGKSTLSYAMNGIIPWRLKGLMKGNVEIFGKSIWDYKFMELSKIVSLVKQNPLEQLVTFTVKDEIAFGLENLKYPIEEIEKKIEEISRFLEIDHLLERDIDQLSGGQKQLTILASFLVMEPKILILDEPIAFLDQHSESLLLNRLKKLIQSPNYNLTLVIIEHRLSRVVNLANKIIVLSDHGEIILEGTVSEILRDRFDELKLCNVRVPWITNIYSEYRKINTRNVDDFGVPTNFQQLLKIPENLNTEQLKKLYQLLIDTEIRPKNLEKLELYDEKIEFDDIYIETLKNISENNINQSFFSKSEDNIILETRDLSFEYPNTGINAINNLSIKIYQGDFIGLVGPNGSGKTTLLYLLANLYTPTSGEIFFNNQNLKQFNPYEYAPHIGFIFQNPENMIFKRTLRDEILYGPKNFGILKKINEEYLSKLFRLIGENDPTKNPFNLSWGQKRRLNLSSIFVYNPEIILLDEPFIGQDQRTIDSIIETLFIENKRGKTIIISSHDYHLLLKYTKRIIELNKDGTLKDYDKKDTYFSRHQNLGPVIFLNKIKELIGERNI
ncbi:MAG: ABC transporter ATP-binding protein [Candidatus Hermodarchaeota archaeon]